MTSFFTPTTLKETLIFGSCERTMRFASIWSHQERRRVVLKRKMWCQKTTVFETDRVRKDETIAEVAAETIAEVVAETIAEVGAGIETETTTAETAADVIDIKHEDDFPRGSDTHLPPRSVLSVLRQFQKVF